MGKIRICDLVPLGDAVEAMFNVNAAAFKLFNKDLINPYMTAVYDVNKTAVFDMGGTRVMITLNKTKTVVRNGFMDLNYPLAKECRYKLKLCIAAATITDLLPSFGVGGVLSTIDKHQISPYHVNFDMMMERINIPANRAALLFRGFTAAKFTALQDNHDLAWEMSTEKIDLTQDTSTLTGANKVIVDTFMGNISVVVDTMYNYYISIGDDVNARRASVAAIMKGIRATPVKKMRNRNVKKTSHIIYQTDFVQRNTMQLQVKSKGSLFIVRSNSKVGPYNGGIELLPGVLRNLKLRDIPGTGRYVVIYSVDTENDGVVGSLIIKG